MLTYQEVAKLLGVSVSSVRQYVAVGALACVRLNHNVVRFRPEQVEKFIKSRTEEAIGG